MPLESSWLLLHASGCGPNGQQRAHATLQVLRVLPYSACQLCSYETYKRLLGGGPDGEGLSVPRRLAAGAAAGMTSTLVCA